jgi:2-polyprenyl-3-methyl-5-hydroxy-6-metoxy-1,4-benzoquinol methylase
VVSEWTNDRAIAQWGAMPRTLLEQTARDGDFAKRHLLNPVLLRLLGDLPGQRVLDAGCGNGYLSRMLASRGAQVTGVEPGQSLFGFAAEQEAVAPRGIRYVQADLCALPDLGAPFDAVVASMVLPAIPDWAGAMAACVQALKPGGCSSSPSTTRASSSCGGPEGIGAYVHLPNFLIVAARRAS